MRLHPSQRANISNEEMLALASQCEELRAQRDELAAALRDVLDAGGDLDVMCEVSAAKHTPAMVEYEPMAKLVEKKLNEIERLRNALREIVTINSESPGACRKRMGTRAGNTLVTARKALDGTPA